MDTNKAKLETLVLLIDELLQRARHVHARARRTLGNHADLRGHTAMRFKVDLVQTVYQICTVEVEAATADEAESKALEASANIHWRFGEVADRDVISVIQYAQPAA